MVLGILSIIAGVFVFFQAGMLNFVSSLHRAFSNDSTASMIAATFMIVAVCLLISGILSIVYSVKPNRQALIGCIFANAIASIMAFTIGSGDMGIWKYVCMLLAVYYLSKLISARKEADPTDFEQVSHASRLPLSGECEKEDKAHIGS